MEHEAVQIDFWDVGQGDCSSIRLPDGRLILIDVGPVGSPLVDWLNERRTPPQIEAIILTHNDADHAGALPAIIAEHKRRIGAVWMLMDRSVKSPAFQKTFRAAEKAESEGWFKIAGLADGSKIWEDGEIAAVLRAVHPGFSEQANAILSGKPNNSSGLLVLEVNGKRLCAWPGDLEIRVVARKLEDQSPWLLNGPHHGGPSDFPSRSVRRKAGKNAGELRKQVVEAIQNIGPVRSFISVGTSNQHQHPRPGYLRLLAQAGAHVACSQLTFCCERHRVRNRNPVFQGSGALGLRPCRKGVSCRGAIRFYLRDGQLVPDEFDSEHRQRVAELLRPQCLRGIPIKS